MSVLVVLQVLLFVLWAFRAGWYYTISPIAGVIAVLLVVYVVNRQEDAYYKIAWSILILVFPVFGGALYLLCAGRQMPKKLFKGTTQANQRMQDLLHQDYALFDEIKEKDAHVAKLFQYGWNTSGFPVYKNTKLTYYKSGEAMWPDYLEELKKAKHFIFLEYFIIDKGEMWDSVLAILRKKVEEGVTVKIIYDDFGCSTTLPYNYFKKLREMGIEAYRFNRLRPAIIIQMNNRDHRKLCIIDNKVGFTGGINLADEYINRIERYGYWKDSAIKVEGEAVWSMTDMFLGMLSFLSGEENIAYQEYRLPVQPVEYDGYVQPFSDTPTDDADTGLSIHLNMINYAKKYIYIDTPYLVINDDVLTALRLAAQNGVDVRILVPHIPDKRYVFEITRSNYEALISAGVKLYEFTPGFNHCKNIVCDDVLGLVGTVNTDYRSYYLHFETGVLFYDAKCIQFMKEDFLHTIEKSQEITLEDCQKVLLPRRIIRSILKLFAPLF